MRNIGLGEIVLILMTLGLLVVLPLMAIIDILKSKFKDNDAAIFVLIVLFAPIIGPILYFVVGSKRKI